MEGPVIHADPTTLIRHFSALQHSMKRGVVPPRQVNSATAFGRNKGAGRERVEFSAKKPA
jgi:hypothetical protein